jgi:hypothetical protein
MTKLIYCATPSRIADKLNEIMDFVTNQNYAPLHPFQALPYKRFEGNPKIGRELSMKWCLELINISDEFWMFGVSKGTLQEVVHAMKVGKPVILQLDIFDPAWKKYYQELKELYNNPLDNLLRNYE